jgi:hypothetical protein
MLPIFKTIFFTLLLTFSLQANNQKTYIEVMELGLKQITAIPAILKDYVMIEMNNGFSDPKEDFKKEIGHFKSWQEKLSKLAVDAETKKAILWHNVIWKKLETILQEPVTKEGFKKVRKYAVPLGIAIKKMIQSAKEKLHTEQGDALFYTGKLSAVSQKFASLYMLLKWGMNNEKLHKDMEKQKEIYAHALAELEKISFTSDETKKVLKKLKKDLLYFEFLEKATKTFMPALVYKKTNAMFDHSNEMMSVLLKN